MRGAALPLVLALSALGCQSHPEKGVVDQYFNAVNSKDSQTLSSFAAVSFDKKVDRWSIKDTLDEQKSDAPLPALSQKVKDSGRSPLLHRPTNKRSSPTIAGTLLVTAANSGLPLPKMVLLQTSAMKRLRWRRSKLGRRSPFASP